MGTPFLQHAPDGVHIDAGGLQQRVGDGLPEVRELVVHVALVGLEHPPHQRVAVGVQAVRGQADDHVPGLHGGAVDEVGLLGDAHAEAGHVELPRAVEAGHLRHLAPHQRAPCLLAAAGHPADDLLHLVGHELLHGQVVEEEDGAGAHGEHVVGAHGHQVDADGVELARLLSHQQLGAHAVGGGDQNGLLHLGHLIEGGEAPQRAQDPGDTGLFHQRGDAAHGLLTGGDVHPGGGVGQAALGWGQTADLAGRRLLGRPARVVVALLVRLVGHQLLLRLGFSHRSKAAGVARSGVGPSRPDTAVASQQAGGGNRPGGRAGIGNGRGRGPSDLPDDHG